jgi:hypothetical protein
VSSEAQQQATIKWIVADSCFFSPSFMWRTMMSIAELASVDFATELRAKTVAVRLRINRWGVRKALDDPHNRRAADEFDASADYLSASKKLINTKHPLYRPITAALNKARQYWQGMTVPYPEDGIRLLRADRVSEFEQGLEQIRQELLSALIAFQCEFSEIKWKARQDLGDLYNNEDYPDSVVDLFKINHEYSEVVPASHLMELHPEIYQREQMRIRQRFEEAVAMAESAFLDELNQLVEHCIERLTDVDSSGKSKKFNDSLIGNFREFIDRFSKLDIGSNQALTDVVGKLKNITHCVEPDMLRRHSAFREAFRNHMETVKDNVSAMIIDRPRRRFAD